MKQCLCFIWNTIEKSKKGFVWITAFLRAFSRSPLTTWLTTFFEMVRCWNESPKTVCFRSGSWNSSRGPGCPRKEPVFWKLQKTAVLFWTRVLQEERFLFFLFLGFFEWKKKNKGCRSEKNHKRRTAVFCFLFQKRTIFLNEPLFSWNKKTKSRSLLY